MTRRVSRPLNLSSKPTKNTDTHIEIYREIHVYNETRRWRHFFVFFVASPPWGVRSVAISVSVCPSVCVSARMSQQPQVQASRTFLYLLTVAVVRSFSDDDAIRYVLPVSSMTSCFHVMRQIRVPAWSVRRSELFTVTRQVAPPKCALGGEVCYRRLPC